MKKRLFIISLILTVAIEGFAQVYSNDIASEGINSWIFHTPDNGTSNYLHIAPGTNSANWQWSKGTVFFNSGFVKFPSDVEVPTKLFVKNKIVLNNSIKFNNSETGPGFALSGNRLLLHVDGQGLISRNKTQDLGIVGWEFRNLRLTGDAFIGNRVAINTTDFGTSDHKLVVEGSIGARSIKVEATGWSDFVFENDYELPSLEQVEVHIERHGHLPEIPSETEVIEHGIDLGEMNAKLLQKIEELTLYLIEQNKQLKLQNTKNEALENKITQLENRIIELE